MGRSNNFGTRGSGTSPLPTYLAYFRGAPNGAVKPNPNLPSSYTTRRCLRTPALSIRWPQTIRILTPRRQPATQGLLRALYADPGRRAQRDRAGLAPNFFLANPGLLGGVNFTGNGGYSRYDGLQVELRRRLSKGLLVQGNYTFARSFTRSRISFRAAPVNSLGDTLEHAFKANWVYELPIGRGKSLFGGAGGALDRLIGGWEFHGTARIQSGNYLNFGNVRLVGMTEKELRKAAKLRFDDADGVAYYLPKDIIDNTDEPSA